MNPNLTSSDHSDEKPARALHLVWEYPPYVQGGMGVAAAGLCEALAGEMAVDVVIPEIEDIAITQAADKVNRCYIPLKGSAVLPQAYDRGEEIVSEPAESLYKNALVNDQADKESTVVAFAKAVRFAHFTKHDVVHAHDWMTALAGVVLQRAEGMPKKPLVYHAHSTHVDRVGSYGRGEVFEHEQWAMQQADCVAVVSEFSKKEVAEQYAVPLEKIAVLRNGISPKEEENHQRTRKEKTILFAGRLVEQKSPEFVVTVMTEVLRQYGGGARGVIAGGGERLKLIREMVKFKKMDSLIEVLGEVPHNKMHVLYANADVLLVPSVSEPFGMVAVEAAQADVAVVLSEHCGVSEVLTSAPKLEIQDFDLWVETVLKLLRDDDLRQQQITSQKKQMEQATWENTAQHTSEVYQKLCAELSDE